MSVAFGGSASIAAIRLLLEKKPAMRRDILHQAAGSPTDALAKVRILLDLDPTLIDSFGEEETFPKGVAHAPLHVAIYDWRLDAARELAARGADLELKASRKWRGGRRGDAPRQLLKARAAMKAETPNPSYEAALRAWAEFEASLPPPKTLAK
jgi:hypothetical protein